MLRQFNVNVLDTAQQTDPEVPTSFIIVNRGRQNVIQDFKSGAFDVSDEDIKTIIDAFNRKGVPLTIDYEHGTLKAASLTGDAPAAGWINKLTEEPEGIRAHVEFWTPKAIDRIKQKELRFFSPVINFNDVTHRADFIHSCALTNHPAFVNAKSLLAANDLTDAESPIAEHQAYIKALCAAQRQLDTLIREAVSSYRALCENDPILSEGLTAFSDLVIDDLFDDASLDDVLQVSPPEGVSAPDEVNLDTIIDNLIEEVSIARGSMPDANFKDWIKARMKSVKTEQERAILEAALENTAGQGSGLMAMSDLTSTLGLPKTASTFELKNEVISMNALRREIPKVLETIGCKSFSDITTLVSGLQNTIREHEINDTIDKLIIDGKAAPSQRPVLIAQAKQNLKAFKDTTAELPKLFSFNSSPIVKTETTGDLGLVGKVKRSYTDSEKRIAEQFKMTPEELYGTELTQ